MVGRVILGLSSLVDRVLYSVEEIKFDGQKIIMMSQMLSLLMWDICDTLGWYKGSCSIDT